MHVFVHAQVSTCVCVRACVCASLVFLRGGLTPRVALLTCNQLRRQEEADLLLHASSTQDPTPYVSVRKIRFPDSGVHLQQHQPKNMNLKIIQFKE